MCSHFIGVYFTVMYFILFSGALLGLHGPASVGRQEDPAWSALVTPGGVPGLPGAVCPSGPGQQEAPPRPGREGQTSQIGEGPSKNQRTKV